MSDLKFNVAQLLREHVGAKRLHQLDDPELDLGEGLRLAPLRGQAKFTRTNAGVLVSANVHGEVTQLCGRCLTDYQQPVQVAFDEEFYATVHVTLGVGLPRPDTDDPFLIDENHLLDLGEALREYTLLELPIAPTCRAACQGICPHCGSNRNEAACACVDEAVDERMAALKQLLDNRSAESN